MTPRLYLSDRLATAFMIQSLIGTAVHCPLCLVVGFYLCVCADMQNESAH